MLDNKISSFHSPAVPPDLFSTDATALKMVSILFDNGLITADIYHQVISRYSARCQGCRPLRRHPTYSLCDSLYYGQRRYSV